MKEQTIQSDVSRTRNTMKIKKEATDVWKQDYIDNNNEKTIASVFDLAQELKTKVKVSACNAHEHTHNHNEKRQTLEFLTESKNKIQNLNGFSI